MVQPETATWLNESRGSFGAAQRRFNDISSMDVTGAAALFMSAEYAVKAVIAEHYGFLPPRFDTHRIVNLSHQIGLWSQLPPRPAGAPCRHRPHRPQRSTAAADGPRRPGRRGRACRCVGSRPAGGRSLPVVLTRLPWAVDAQCTPHASLRRHFVRYVAAPEYSPITGSRGWRHQCMVDHFVPCDAIN